MNRHTSILRTPNELGADNEAQAFDFTEDEMSRPKGGKYPDVLLEDYKPGSGQDVDPRKLLVADQDGEQRVVDLVRLNEVMMRKTRNRYPDLTLPQRIERNVTLGLGSLIRSPKARILGESLKDISDDAVVYTSGSMKDGSYRELYWGDIKAASDPGRGLAGLADKLQQQGDSVQRVIQLLESMIELRRQLEREGIKVGEVLKAYNAKLAMIERAERAHSETMQVLSQAQLRLSALQREQEEKVRDGKTVTLEESAAVTKLLERLQQRREASAAARAKIDQLQSDPKFVQMQSIVERLAIPREFAYLGRLSYMSEAGLQAKLNYYQKRQEALYRGAQQRRDAAARYRARPQESYKYWNPWEDAVLQGEGIETAMDRAGYGDEGEYDYSRNPEDTKFLTSRQVKDINRLIAQYTKKFKNNVAWDLIELGFPRTDFEVDGEVEMSSADAVDYLEDVKAGFRDPPREFEDERVEVLESPARYEERAAVLKEKIGEFSARYPHIARLLDVSELKVSKEERANSARAAFNFLFTVSPKTREAVFKHVQNLIDLVDVSRLWKRRLDIDKEARAPRGVKSAEANLPSPLPGRPTTAQPTVASLTKLREPLVAAIVEAKARIAEAEQAPAAAKLPPRTAEMVKKFETKGVEQDPIKFAQAHVSFLEGQIAKLDRAIAQASNEPEPARVTKPELPAAPNASLTKKDRAKWAMANKFIGRGSPRSSTAKYAAALQSFANTGAYTANDVVFVSAEGNRAGRMPPDFAEIDRAIAAGATIITDRKGRTNEFGTRSGLYNVGEREVAQHLERSGYAETNGDGVWKPAASPADMGLADSGVADVVTAFNGVSDGQLAEARVVALQKLRTEAKAQVFGRLETLAMRIAKLVGLPEIKLMTPDELRQHYREKAAYATDKQAIAEEFLQKVSLTEEQRGTYGSYYGRLAGRDDVLQIWISPALKDQTAMISVLAHEIGHAIYRTHFKNANQDTRDQVLRAYESWVVNEAVERIGASDELFHFRRGVDSQPDCTLVHRAGSPAVSHRQVLRGYRCGVQGAVRRDPQQRLHDAVEYRRLHARSPKRNAGRR